MRCRVQRFLRVSRVVSFQIERIHFQHIMCITQIYMLQRKTKHQGHTHLSALGGRKQRLLEAGHCCAGISVVGSSFFRLTRCERFRNFVRGGCSTFAKRYDLFPIPPKDSSIRRRYGYYIHTKKWINRRVEGDWRPRSSQVSCWRHNPIRRLQGPPPSAVSRAQRRCADVAQRREAKIASIN